jgi:pyridoxamine 5'-phosphate oxidase
MPDTKKIFHNRREYEKGHLTEENLPDHPFELFDAWYSEAMEAKLTDANAMVLATCDKNCKPSTRVVLLKAYSPAGFVFFTNYESKKGREIIENPHVALNFYWRTLEKQVHVCGVAERITAEESDEYFQSRPRGSQIAACISPQSMAIAREALDSKFHTFEHDSEGEMIKRPGNWGGFIVKATEIEFWQGRSNRLHDRILYFQENEKWDFKRLAP